MPRSQLAQFNQETEFQITTNCVDMRASQHADNTACRPSSGWNRDGGSAGCTRGEGASAGVGYDGVADQRMSRSEQPAGNTADVTMFAPLPAVARQQRVARFRVLSLAALR
jgi:hypothetical protein